MHNKSIIAQGATYAMLLTSMAFLSAFRSTGNEGPQGTYLRKISSASGQTTMEYNADRTIKKIVQLRKTENAGYNDVLLPVYENGRLVKTLSADEEKPAGDLNTVYAYAANGKAVQKISYYRNNEVYTQDSLVYNEAGKISARYQINKNPQKGAWEVSGYQLYTWNAEGDVAQMDNYGKQPGYSRFVALSSVSYTYDKKQNPQQLLPELAYILDMAAPNLSAHNVLTETISNPHASRTITNTYTYAYGGQFPVRATFNSGLDNETVKLEWVRLQ
ncbi:MAG TPA: hypothetical protein VM802_31060 [Chitinophaga sp.]|uniref:hypothetical protein n=1 Tax=Chitinophaga sp. TaxID=1869181 RepID=UPI002CE0EB01|nr:hypothetical protein [Chitinophaga sp.]HVI49346.1 hypothetical protein [Chitinophaga sp.]